MRKRSGPFHAPCERLSGQNAISRGSAWREPDAAAETGDHRQHNLARSTRKTLGMGGGQRGREREKFREKSMPRHGQRLALTTVFLAQAFSHSLASWHGRNGRPGLRQPCHRELAGAGRKERSAAGMQMRALAVARGRKGTRDDGNVRTGQGGKGGKFWVGVNGSNVRTGFSGSSAKFPTE